MAIVLYDGMASELPGVKRDVFDYEKFLISPYGGSWKEHEIKTINVKEWEKGKIKKLCQSCTFKYLLLVFIGHGSQDRNSRTYFLAKHNIPCYVDEINNCARKQLTIVDCCRVGGDTLIRESVMEKVAYVQKYKDTSLAFFNQLNQASDQHITLYACSPSEEANDACSYSYYLLKCAYLTLQGETDKYLSVKDAHEVAKQEMSKNAKILQNPDIVESYGSDSEKLPFAISANLT